MLELVSVCFTNVCECVELRDFSKKQGRIWRSKLGIKALQNSRIGVHTASVELFLAHVLILFGGMLIAVQLQLQSPLSRGLPAGYRAQHAGVYGVLILSVLVVQFLGLTVPPNTRFQALLANTHPFRKLLVSISVSAVLIMALLPQIAHLQILWFCLTSVLLGVVCIAIPFRIYLGRPETNLLTDVCQVWHNRALLRVWLSFNIQTRYSQRILGILWIIILPISTAIVLTIAFTQFMRVQLDVPYIAFYLAALVPYNLFSNGVNQSAVAILGKIGIITQVYFPREILVLIVLGEVLIDFLFTFISMMLINALSGVWPTVAYVYLPLLAGILVCITLGIMFLVSSLTILVRDIPQLTAVIMQLFFFLTPVIYPIENIPDDFRFLLLVNPIASLIQGFRTIIIYGQSPDWVSLYYPLVFAGAILVLGYATFKSIEHEMADIL